MRKNRLIALLGLCLSSCTIHNFITAPDAPSGVTAQAANRGATLTWDVPYDGGSAITGYVIQISPGGATIHVPVPNPPTSQVIQAILGLDNGSTYTFQVQAENRTGGGFWSTASNPVTPSPTAAAAGAPEAPQAVVVGITGNNSVNVTWQAPSPGNSPITGYIITAEPGNIQYQVGPLPSSADITGLDGATPYTFTVAAENIYGFGPPSAPSLPVATTGSSTAPGQIGPWQGYHVAAAQGATFPPGAIGFIVTANGQGAYTVAWQGSAGLETFSGAVLHEGSSTLSQITPAGNGVQFGTSSTNPNELDFNSAPGRNLNSITFIVTPATAPFQLTAEVNGTEAYASIYFVAAGGQLAVSQSNPVAFVSP